MTGFRARLFINHCDLGPSLELSISNSLYLYGGSHVCTVHTISRGITRCQIRRDFGHFHTRSDNILVNSWTPFATPKWIFPFRFFFPLVVYKALRLLLFKKSCCINLLEFRTHHVIITTVSCTRASCNIPCPGVTFPRACSCPSQGATWKRGDPRIVSASRSCAVLLERTRLSNPTHAAHRRAHSRSTEVALPGYRINRKAWPQRSVVEGWSCSTC